MVIKFSDHLEHGPFPAARLKAGNFAPLMAVSHARLTPTPSTQKWFDALKDKDGSPVSASTTIGFSGTGHSVWLIKPFKIAKEDGKAAFSGGTINVDLANDYRDKTVTGEFGSFAMTDATGTRPE